MKRAEIVDAARLFLEVPWKHEGRSMGGMDCIGLVQAVGDVFGLHYQDKRGYSASPTDLEFMNHLLKYLTRNKGAAIIDGSVVLFRQNRYPCHVGIFATNEFGQRTYIHSSMQTRKVTETLYDPEGGMKIVMTLEFPGVED